MSSSSGIANLSQQIDFDLIMPSSARRMDYVLPTPVLSPALNLVIGEAQGMKEGSPSSVTHSKIPHHKPSVMLERTSSPDPRWPLLNRWSGSSLIAPASILKVITNLGTASPSSVVTSVRKDTSYACDYTFVSVSPSWRRDIH